MRPTTKNAWLRVLSFILVIGLPIIGAICTARNRVQQFTSVPSGRVVNKRIFVNNTQYGSSVTYLVDVETPTGIIAVHVTSQTYRALHIGDRTLHSSR